MGVVHGGVEELLTMRQGMDLSAGVRSHAGSPDPYRSCSHNELRAHLQERIR
jgi:hypothetical protein